MLGHGLKILVSSLVFALTFASFSASAAEPSKYQDAFKQICRDVAARHPDGARLDCEKLSSQFAGEVNSAEAVRSALKSAFSSAGLRGYEVLSAPAAVAHELKATSSEIGIGVSLREANLVSKGLQVSSVMDDSTAQAAGLRKGDIIVGVDFKSVVDKSPYEATQLLQGTPGSFVTLGLYRDGVATTVIVQRDIDEKLGIEVQPLVRTAVEVSHLSETGPAVQAGLKEKDIIVAINSASTDGKSVDDVYNIVDGGAEGSLVELKVLRDGQFEYVVVQRKALENFMKTLWDIRGQMGGSDDWYRVSVSHLDWRSLPERMDGFLEDFNEHRDLILDLRGASGNDAELAARFAARFMTDGFVLSTVDGAGLQTSFVMEGGKLFRKESGGAADTTVEVAISGKRFDKRLTVLTDAGTSGTAEALASALQKSGRARVIGQASSGKSKIISTYRVLVDASPVTVLAEAGHVTTADGTPFRAVEPDLTSWISDEIVDQALAEIRGDGLWMSKTTMFYYTALAVLVLFGVALLIGRFIPSSSSDESEPEAEEEALDKNGAEDDSGDKKDDAKGKSAGTLIAVLLGFIFVPVMLVGIIAAISKYQDERSPVRGEIVVKAFVDGSELSKMQAGIVDDISKQYQGSIRFDVVDVQANPEAAGEVKNFPTVEIAVLWYNAEGKEVSSQRSWRHAMPKREIHQYLEIYKKSSGSKKEIPITRVPR